MMAGFRRIVICSRCEWEGYAGNQDDGHGAMFLFHDSICPNCGNVSRLSESFGNFVVIVQRWVKSPKQAWWNPLTWMAGQWVDVSEGKQAVVEHTPRGFEIVRFRDLGDRDCTLQQSSLAIYDEPGTGGLWLGLESDGDTRMHLDETMVRSLVLHLESWLADGHFNQGPTAN